jgi:hypothetical protein
MRKPTSVAVAFFILCGLAQSTIAKDSNKEKLVVRAVAYRAVPHERTTYYRTQGYSNTTCYGSGSDWGYSTSLDINCQTVISPPQDVPVTVRSVEVYNALEANGRLYTVTCTAHWVGSKCAWVNPGDSFEAEVSGTTMWVNGRRGGNMGKVMRTKFKIVDIRAR